MKHDFNSFEFVTIENYNLNAPVLYINTSGVSFNHGVLDYLNNPSFVLFMIDAKKRVLAVQACKPTETKAFKVPKTNGKPTANVGFKNRNLFEPILQCIDVTIRTGQHLKVTGFWVAENKTLCFDLNEVVLEEWKGRHNNRKQEADT